MQTASESSLYLFYYQNKNKTKKIFLKYIDVTKINGSKNRYVTFM